MPLGGIRRFSLGGKSQTSSAIQTEDPPSDDSTSVKVPVASTGDTDSMWMSFDQPGASSINDSFGENTATDFSYSDNFSVGGDMMESSSLDKPKAAALAAGNTGLTLFNKQPMSTTETTQDNGLKDFEQEPPQENNRVPSLLSADNPTSEVNPMREQAKELSLSSLSSNDASTTQQRSTSQQPRSGLSLFCKGHSLSTNHENDTSNQAAKHHALELQDSASQRPVRPAIGNNAPKPTGDQPTRPIPNNVHQPKPPNQKVTPIANKACNTTTATTTSTTTYQDMAIPDEPPQVLPVPRTAVKTASSRTSTTSPPVQIQTPVNGILYQSKIPASNLPYATSDPQELLKQNSSSTPTADRTHHTTQLQLPQLNSNKTLPVVTPGPHTPPPLCSTNSQNQSDSTIYGKSPIKGVGAAATVPNKDQEQHAISFGDAELGAYVDDKAKQAPIEDMDFDDLHVKFLSDIRDLQDLQHENSELLINLEKLLSTAYSECLQDHAKFLDLEDQLEKASGSWEDMIHRFQEF